MCMDNEVIVLLFRLAVPFMEVVFPASKDCCIGIQWWGAAAMPVRQDSLAELKYSCGGVL